MVPPANGRNVYRLSKRTLFFLFFFSFISKIYIDRVESIVVTVSDDERTCFAFVASTRPKPVLVLRIFPSGVLDGIKSEGLPSAIPSMARRWQTVCKAAERTFPFPFLRFYAALRQRLFPPLPPTRSFSFFLFFYVFLFVYFSFVVTDVRREILYVRTPNPTLSHSRLNPVPVFPNDRALLPTVLLLLTTHSRRSKHTARGVLFLSFFLNSLRDVCPSFAILTHVGVEVRKFQTNYVCNFLYRHFFFSPWKLRCIHSNQSSSYSRGG